MNPADERPENRTPKENASAVRSLTGLRSWGAVLVALLLSAAGVAVDALTVNPPLPSWGLRVGFVAGVGLAALAVRRGSIFTAMVQPPLVLLAVGFIALRLMTTERLTFTLIKFVNLFPTMLTGTALALIIGLIRIVTQPLHVPRAASRPQGAHL